MHRVVITGIGVVSPIGSTNAAFWSAVVEGRSGIGPITNMATDRLNTPIAAEVRDFDPLQHFDPKILRHDFGYLHQFLCGEPIGPNSAHQP